MNITDLLTSSLRSDGCGLIGKENEVSAREERTILSRNGSILMLPNNSHRLDLTCRVERSFSMERPASFKLMRAKSQNAFCETDKSQPLPVLTRTSSTGGMSDKTDELYQSSEYDSDNEMVTPNMPGYQHASVLSRKRGRSRSSSPEGVLSPLSNIFRSRSPSPELETLRRTKSIRSQSVIRNMIIDRNSRFHQSQGNVYRWLSGMRIVDESDNSAENISKENPPNEFESMSVENVKPGVLVPDLLSPLCNKSEGIYTTHSEKPDFQVTEAGTHSAPLYSFSNIMASKNFQAQTPDDHENLCQREFNILSPSQAAAETLLELQNSSVNSNSMVTLSTKPSEDITEYNPGSILGESSHSNPPTRLDIIQTPEFLTPIPSPEPTGASIVDNLLVMPNATEPSTVNNLVPTPDATETSPVNSPLPTPDATETSPVNNPLPTPDVTETSPVNSPLPTPDATETSPVNSPLPTPYATETSPVNNPLPTLDVTATSQVNSPLPTPDATETSPVNSPLPTPDSTETSPINSRLPTPDSTETSPINSPLPIPNAGETSPVNNPLPTPDATETSPVNSPLPTPYATETSPVISPLPSLDAAETSPVSSPLPTLDATETSPVNSPLPTPDSTETSPVNSPLPTPDAAETSPVNSPLPKPDATETSPANSPLPTTDATETSPANSPLPTTDAIETLVAINPLPPNASQTSTVNIPLPITGAGETSSVNILFPTPYATATSPVNIPLPIPNAISATTVNSLLPTQDDIQSLLTNFIGPVMPSSNVQSQSSVITQLPVSTPLFGNPSIAAVSNSGLLNISRCPLTCPICYPKKRKFNTSPSKSKATKKRRSDSNIVIKRRNFGINSFQKITTRSLNRRLRQRTSNHAFHHIFMKKAEIFKAAEEGDLECVKNLIQDTGATVLEEKSNCTLLHVAAANNQPDVVLFLLQLINPNVVNKDGQTPAHLAAIKGHTQVLRILMGDKEFDPKKLDKECHTYKDLLSKTLLESLIVGNIKTMKSLVKAGADPDMQVKGASRGILSRELGITTPRLLAQNLNKHFLQAISKTDAGKSRCETNNTAHVTLNSSLRRKSTKIPGRNRPYPLKLSLVTSGQQMSGPDVYKLDTDPRGYVCVLNYNTFQNQPDLHLQGSHTDANNLANIFGKMGYTGDVHSSLSLKETKDVLLRVRDMEVLDDVGCAIFIISSHGVGHDSFLTGDMNYLRTEWVMNLFRDSECPRLKNKPKMFIFNMQNNPVVGMNITDEPAFVLPRLTEPLQDTVCLHASGVWPTSSNSSVDGTPFITSLCRSLALYAHHKELGDLYRECLTELKKVTQDIVPQFRNFGFTKKFYFNPKFQH